MKVLVIVTGGTIGSTWSNGTIGLKKQSEFPLLSLYLEKMESLGIQDIEFIMTSPYQLLSENSTGKVLKRLAESIYAGIEQAEQEGCQGMIVTHGTDTLAYSASMAGYLFMDCPIPVVFVSANYVLSDHRSNGLDNFHYALKWIRNHTGGGIYVSYRNTGEIPRIHLGTRLLGHQPYSDNVYSVGGACAWFDRDGMHDSFDWQWEQSAGENGQTEQGMGTVDKQVWVGAVEQSENGEDVNCSGKREDRSRGSARWRNLQWDAPILQIHPSPGMRYPAIPPETKAVLHHTYHAGTICSETPGIDLFFEEAGKRQIPVFLTGADPELVYDSTRIFDGYGIHVLPTASPVSMYMKLWLLLVSGRDPVEWMDREMAGEFPLGERGR